MKRVWRGDFYYFFLPACFSNSVEQGSGRGWQLFLFVGVVEEPEEEEDESHL